MAGAGKRTHYAKLDGAVSDSERSQIILHNSFIYEVFSYSVHNIANFMNIMYNLIMFKL